MTRRYHKRSHPNPLILLIILIAILLTVTGTQAELPPAVQYALFFLASIAIVIATIALALFIYRLSTKRKRAQNMAALASHNVDAMSGTEFEIFLKHLLTARGFKVKGMYHGKDGGVDLIAKIGDRIYSIQAKRYKEKKHVDRRAITDAVAGITYRNCTHAMAITNSYFTKDAKKYALTTKCELVDRDLLAEWIYQLNAGR